MMPILPLDDVEYKRIQLDDNLYTSNLLNIIQETVFQYTKVKKSNILDSDAANLFYKYLREMRSKVLMRIIARYFIKLINNFFSFDKLTLKKLEIDVFYLNTLKTEEPISSILYSDKIVMRKFAEISRETWFKNMLIPSYEYYYPDDDNVNIQFNTDVGNIIILARGFLHTIDNEEIGRNLAFFIEYNKDTIKHSDVLEYCKQHNYSPCAKIRKCRVSILNSDGDEIANYPVKGQF